MCTPAMAKLRRKRQREDAHFDNRIEMGIFPLPLLRSELLFQKYGWHKSKAAARMCMITIIWVPPFGTKDRQGTLVVPARVACARHTILVLPQFSVELQLPRLSLPHMRQPSELEGDRRS